MSVLFCIFSKTWKLFQTFLPLIKKAAKAQLGVDLSVSRGAVINITSDSGSIGYGVKESFESDADMYGYRMSKVHRFLFKIELNGPFVSAHCANMFPYISR